MPQQVHNIAPWLTILCSLVLSACGGNSATTDTSRVLQESELYHPVTNPTGVVEQPGQTAVIGLQMNTSDLPPLANVASKGVEDLWFEVKDAQSMQIALDADMLAAIDRVEIRDQNNALLATINATTPSTTLTLAPGRYQALVYASAADTETVAVFVQYASGQGDSTRTRGASASDKAQSQDIYLRDGKLFLATGCPGCNLAGKDFARWKLNTTNLVGADFSGSNLSGANLSGAFLSSANLTKADLTKADLTDANLLSTNLTSANLSGANLSGAWLNAANLTTANLTAANFTGANLSGANLLGTEPSSAIWRYAELSGAMWSDGRRCQTGSFGSCRQ